MPIIEMPNGDQVQFPDGMPKEQIRDLIASKFPEVGQAQTAPDPRTSGGIYDMLPKGVGNVLKGISHSADGVGAGLLMGFDDEAQAALSTLGGGDYSENQREFDAQKARRREESPVASIAGELAGGLTVGGGLASKGITLAGRNLPFIGKTGAAALEGAAYGGLTGAGEASQGERTRGALTGAAIGAATGGALSKASDGIANMATRRAANKAMPTVDDMQQEAHQLYETMRQSGVVVREQRVNHLKSNINLRLRETTSKLSPQAYALKEMAEEQLAGDVGIKELHNFSKSVNRVARSPLDGEDAHFVGQIKDFVDDMIFRIQPRDIKGPVGAVQLKKQADELWKRSSKSELIEDLFEQARNQATGFENGLVIKFRQLANNKKQMRLFSKEEQALIKDLVRRGSVRGILKGLGMLSPTSTFGGITTGAMGVGSGIVPAAALGGVGYGSRQAAEAITRNKAGFIQSSVRSGTAPLLDGTRKSIPFIGGVSGQLASPKRR